MLTVMGLKSLMAHARRDFGMRVQNELYQLPGLVVVPWYLCLKNLFFEVTMVMIVVVTHDPYRRDCVFLNEKNCIAHD